MTSFQRAGSALQSMVHFHTAALDGVYLVSDDDNDDEPPQFLVHGSGSLSRLLGASVVRAGLHAEQSPSVAVVGLRAPCAMGLAHA